MTSSKPIEKSLSIMFVFAGSLGISVGIVGVFIGEVLGLNELTSILMIVIGISFKVKLVYIFCLFKLETQHLYMS